MYWWWKNGLKGHIIMLRRRAGNIARYFVSCNIQIFSQSFTQDFIQLPTFAAAAVVQCPNPSSIMIQNFGEWIEKKRRRQYKIYEIAGRVVVVRRYRYCLLDPEPLFQNS